MLRARLCVTVVVASIILGLNLSHAQTLGEKLRLTAVAIVNNNLASGAGIVQMQVTRWSTMAERNALLNTLRTKGPEKLLDALQKAQRVGTIKTPDSLGYDLRYAYQTPTEEGGRRIVLATDRPIGFWEVTRGRRTLDYPFTVIQMEIGKDGKGKGTLSYATKIIAQGDSIVLENFATQPVMLTQIKVDSEDR